MSELVFGLVLIAAGVVAVLWFSARPPRVVKSPSDASGASALVEASVPVESVVFKRSLLPVREVSLHTVPCDGNVVEGSPNPSRAVLHHEFLGDRP